MKDKKYSWNRNVSHHRIALTRFAVFSYVMSVPLGIITILAIGLQSDGSKEYVVQSAAAGALVMVGGFMSIFLAMSVMYRWICDLDADTQPTQKPPPPPHRPTDHRSTYMS